MVFVIIQLLRACAAVCPAYKQAKDDSFESEDYKMAEMDNQVCQALWVTNSCVLVLFETSYVKTLIIDCFESFLFIGLFGPGCQIGA